MTHIIEKNKQGSFIEITDELVAAWEAQLNDEPEFDYSSLFLTEEEELKIDLDREKELEAEKIFKSEKIAALKNEIKELYNLCEKLSQPVKNNNAKVWVGDDFGGEYSIHFINQRKRYNKHKEACALLSAKEKELNSIIA